MKTLLLCGVIGWGFLVASQAQAELVQQVSIVESSSADITLHGRIIGQATVPAGTSFELVGEQNGRYLLRSGQSFLLVNSWNTDYCERALAAQLAPVPDAPAVSVVVAATDGAIEADSVVSEFRRPEQEISPRPVFRPVDRTYFGYEAPVVYLSGYPAGYYENYGGPIYVRPGSPFLPYVRPNLPARNGLALSVKIR